MASLSVPKTKVGKSKYKLEKISLNHDVSTSTDWGFVQPIMVKKMVADSTLHLNALRSVVRCSPLIKPTFGSASWRTYHYFIKMAELYPPYECFVSGKPYFVASQNSNYIPTQMPWIYVSDLTRMLLGNDNKYTVFYQESNETWTSLAQKTQAVQTGVVSAFISNTTLTNGQESGITSTQYVPFNGTGDLNLNSADFVIEDTVTYSNVSYHILVCFRLSRLNRNIRKVLIGCGYQLDPNLRREVCVLPLMAYFRAWFDLFAVKRNLGWTGTNCYNILDYMKENAVTNIVANNYVRVHFRTLLQEISLLCFYSCDPDFISSHIPTPAVGTSLNQTLEVNSNQTLSVSQYNPTANASEQPSISNSARITRNLILALDKLAKAINKDSQIGQRVDTWLAAHGFGRSLVDVDPHFIGSDSVPIDIQSVMSTADTEDAGLGDYAGTAFGSKPNNQYPNFHYTTDAPGYWITLACCVPDAGWFQGLAPDSGVLDFRRYDEYWSEYDAVGFEISNKDQVVCDGSVSTIVKAASDPVPFGFIPRYSHHKVTQNIVNGDISLRSLQNDALPYTLDRYITPKSLHATYISGEGAAQFYSVVTNENEVPISSPEYRYLGKTLFMGNFDRIFQQYDLATDFDSTLFDYYPNPDHFIVHNYFDVSYMAPMLSMQDSYDTDSFDNDTMSIEKV